MEPVFEKSRVGWSTRGARVAPSPSKLEDKREAAECKIAPASPLQLLANFDTLDKPVTATSWIVSDKRSIVAR